MSENKSWKRNYQSYTEVAIETVRECVKVLRSRGAKTDVALRDLAPVLGTSDRRPRTLFNHDGDPIVLKNEWMQLRYRAGLLFLDEAKRLRDIADKYETAGEEGLVANQQMEFRWGTAWNEKSSCRRSA